MPRSRFQLLMTPAFLITLSVMLREPPQFVVRARPRYSAPGIRGGRGSRDHLPHTGVRFRADRDRQKYRRARSGPMPTHIDATGDRVGGYAGDVAHDKPAARAGDGGIKGRIPGKQFCFVRQFGAHSQAACGFRSSRNGGGAASPRKIASRSSRGVRKQVSPPWLPKNDAPG